MRWTPPHHGVSHSDGNTIGTYATHTAYKGFSEVQFYARNDQRGYEPRGNPHTFRGRDHIAKARKFAESQLEAGHDR